MRKIFMTGFVVVLVAGGLSVQAESAQADEVPYFSPSHVWIDNVINPTGAFAVEFHGFTSLAGHAVTHGTAPRILPVDSNANMVTHCEAPSPTGVSSFGCDTRSEPTSAVAPGEYSTAITIMEDVDGVGVLRYSGTLPITICSGSCSSLFSLAVSPEPLRFLVNSELESQAQGTLEFNVDWNATAVAFGEVVNGSGTSAPGQYTVAAAAPANGSQFGFTGSFSQPGEYSLQVAVTDEFGAVHLDDVAITVCSNDYCLQGLPQLASTGPALDGVVGLSVLLLVAGWGVRRARQLVPTK